MEQAILGASLMLNIVLAVILIAAWQKFGFGLNRLLGQFDVVKLMVSQLGQQIAALPAPVQNIFPLGVKPGKVKTGIDPINIPISPESFRIDPGKLGAKLIEGLGTVSHPDTSTLAYCILKHAGVDEMLEGKSWKEVQQALTRLLNNEDEKTIEYFLLTLADSIATATMPEMLRAPEES